jgi:ornithine cyclodeaminase/alanine dehydrogenase-like protein (mu-crystallin family)
MAARLSDTLILTRRDIAELMRVEDYLLAAESAFRALVAGRAHNPPPMHIAGASGAFHAKGASLDNRHVAIKLNGNFPANPARGLPTIQGAILLADANTGVLLAIMDSIEITLRRTAAASALAARHLARKDSARLAICGCGAQAPAQLEALLGVLVLRELRAWDRDRAHAEAFASAAAKKFAIKSIACSKLREATAKADVIVTCTTASAPFLDVDGVPGGAFIAAVGADNPEKNEIAPALMAKGKIVVDVPAQCAIMGDLHHALDAGAVTLESVHAALGEIVADKKLGRTSAVEIIIFDSTGTAAQDVAAAAAVYERALQAKVGMRTALGAL